MRSKVTTATAIVHLLRARLLVSTVRFENWRNRLGQDYGKAPTDADIERAKRLARHVDWAARLLPIEVKCLPQAMACSFMLKSEQIEHQLVLAVRRLHSRQQPDILHAWVEVGGETILGDLPGEWIETLRLGEAK